MLGHKLGRPEGMPLIFTKQRWLRVPRTTESKEVAHFALGLPTVAASLRYYRIWKIWRV